MLVPGNGSVIPHCIGKGIHDRTRAHFTVPQSASTPLVFRVVSFIASGVPYSSPYMVPERVHRSVISDALRLPVSREILAASLKVGHDEQLT